jgi:hypothetical protein
MLNCKARWYSAPGAAATPPAGWAPVGVTAGVVHTKWVVSISIFSLHFARISFRASFAFSRSTLSATFAKHTEIPLVSAIVCVRTRMRFEGYVPAVVRRMSWNVYEVSTESPESFVEKLLSALGIAARRWLFLYMSNERSFAVASLIGGHSSVTEVWVTLRT